MSSVVVVMSVLLVLNERCGRWHERRRRPAWRIDLGASVEAPVRGLLLQGLDEYALETAHGCLRREPSGMRHRDAQGSSLGV